MTEDIASVSGASEARYCTFLPTINGAIRRDLVTSVRFERIEGDFKGGATNSWRVVVTVEGVEDPVSLRPLFFDPSEFARFVDQAFPGAYFALLPPLDLEGHLGASVPEGARAAGGTGTADAIRTVGDGLAGGNPYEPFQDTRGSGGHKPGQPQIG